MNLLGFISVFMLTVCDVCAQYCTAICMTKFQQSITEITGTRSSETTTMLAPFHKIIASTTDNRSAHKQIRSLCSRVKNWETCVRSCSRDSARAILLSSMDQWKKFCAVMRKPTRASNEYLNCEREHQQQVSEHCDSYMPNAFTITVFCKSLEKYRDCSNRYLHRCSDEAFLIKKQIDDAIQHSFEKVMKHATNRIRLPQRCNMYHRNHYYNKQKGEINHNYIDPPSTILPETTTFLPSTTTEIAISSVLSDVFARQIEMSKIEKPSNPCECEVKHCPPKCFTSATTTTTLATTTTTVADVSTTPFFEESEEPQLLVNSYPFIFQLSPFLFLFSIIIAIGFNF